MKTINFSIIIPHYNIPELLEKLLLTTPYGRDDVEVIVVDDRSDSCLDRLLEIKRQYEAKGILFFRNNNGKKGAGTCRNIGLKHASGKWVLFADSDDIFKEDMYSLISEYRDSDADAVYFEADSMDINTGETSDRHLLYNGVIENYLEDPSKENELKLRYGVINPWCKLVKRSVIEENSIRFNETLVANDVAFSTAVGFYAKNIEVRDKAIYVVTARSGSLTRSFDKSIYMTRNRVFVQRCAFLRKNLSRSEWMMLDLNGHDRLIAMMEEGYPLKDVAGSAIYFLVNHVKPVDFQKINIKTVFGTVKGIFNKRLSF